MEGYVPLTAHLNLSGRPRGRPGRKRKADNNSAQTKKQKVASEKKSTQQKKSRPSTSGVEDSTHEGLKIPLKEKSRAVIPKVTSKAVPLSSDKSTPSRGLISKRPSLPGSSAEPVYTNISASRRGSTHSSSREPVSVPSLSHGLNPTFSIPRKISPHVSSSAGRIADSEKTPEFKSNFSIPRRSSTHASAGERTHFTDGLLRSKSSDVPYSERTLHSNLEPKSSFVSKHGDKSIRFSIPKKTYDLKEHPSNVGSSGSSSLTSTHKSSKFGSNASPLVSPSSTAESATTDFYTPELSDKMITIPKSSSVAPCHSIESTSYVTPKSSKLSRKFSEQSKNVVENKTEAKVLSPRLSGEFSKSPLSPTTNSSGIFSTPLSHTKKSSLKESPADRMFTPNTSFTTLPTPKVISVVESPQPSSSRSMHTTPKLHKAVKYDRGTYPTEMDATSSSNSSKADKSALISTSSQSIVKSDDDMLFATPSTSRTSSAHKTKSASVEVMDNSGSKILRESTSEASTQFNLVRSTISKKTSTDGTRVKSKPVSISNVDSSAQQVSEYAFVQPISARSSDFSQRTSTGMIHAPSSDSKISTLSSTVSQINDPISPLGAISKPSTNSKKKNSSSSLLTDSSNSKKISSSNKLVRQPPVLGATSDTISKKPFEQPSVAFLKTSNVGKISTQFSTAQVSDSFMKLGPMRSASSNSETPKLSAPMTEKISSQSSLIPISKTVSTVGKGSEQQIIPKATVPAGKSNTSGSIGRQLSVKFSVPGRSSAKIPSVSHISSISSNAEKLPVKFSIPGRNVVQVPTHGASCSPRLNTERFRNPYSSGNGDASAHTAAKHFSVKFTVPGRSSSVGRNITPGLVTNLLSTPPISHREKIAEVKSAPPTQTKINKTSLTFKRPKKCKSKAGTSSLAPSNIASSTPNRNTTDKTKLSATTPASRVIKPSQPCSTLKANIVSKNYDAKPVKAFSSGMISKPVKIASTTVESGTTRENFTFNTPSKRTNEVFTVGRTFRESKLFALNPVRGLSSQKTLMQSLTPNVSSLNSTAVFGSPAAPVNKTKLSSETSRSTKSGFISSVFGSFTSSTSKESSVLKPSTFPRSTVQIPVVKTNLELNKSTATEEKPESFTTPRVRSHRSVKKFSVFRSKARKALKEAQKRKHRVEKNRTKIIHRVKSSTLQKKLKRFPTTSKKLVDKRHVSFGKIVSNRSISNSTVRAKVLQPKKSSMPSSSDKTIRKKSGNPEPIKKSILYSTYPSLNPLPTSKNTRRSFSQPSRNVKSADVGGNSKRPFIAGPISKRTKSLPATKNKYLPSFSSSSKSQIKEPLSSKKYASRASNSREPARKITFQRSKSAGFTQKNIEKLAILKTLAEKPDVWPLSMKSRLRRSNSCNAIIGSIDRSTSRLRKRSGLQIGKEKKENKLPTLMARAKSSSTKVKTVSRIQRSAVRGRQKTSVQLRTNKPLKPKSFPTPSRNSTKLLKKNSGAALTVIKKPSAEVTRSRSNSRNVSRGTRSDNALLRNGKFMIPIKSARDDSIYGEVSGVGFMIVERKSIVPVTKTLPSSSVTKTRLVSRKSASYGPSLRESSLQGNVKRTGSRTLPKKRSLSQGSKIAVTSSDATRRGRSRTRRLFVPRKPGLTTSFKQSIPKLMGDLHPRTVPVVNEDVSKQKSFNVLDVSLKKTNETVKLAFSEARKGIIKKWTETQAPVPTELKPAFSSDHRSNTKTHAATKSSMSPQKTSSKRHATVPLVKASRVSSVAISSKIRKVKVLSKETSGIDPAFVNHGSRFDYTVHDARKNKSKPYRNSSDYSRRIQLEKTNRTPSQNVEIEKKLNQRKELMLKVEKKMLDEEHRKSGSTVIQDTNVPVVISGSTAGSTDNFRCSTPFGNPREESRTPTEILQPHSERTVAITNRLIKEKNPRTSSAQAFLHPGEISLPFTDQKKKKEPTLASSHTSRSKHEFKLIDAKDASEKKRVPGKVLKSFVSNKISADLAKRSRTTTKEQITFRAPARRPTGISAMISSSAPAGPRKPGTNISSKSCEQLSKSTERSSSLPNVQSNSEHLSKNSTIKRTTVKAHAQLSCPKSMSAKCAVPVPSIAKIREKVAYRAVSGELVSRNTRKVTTRKRRRTKTIFMLRKVSPPIFRTRLWNSKTAHGYKKSSIQSRPFLKFSTSGKKLPPTSAGRSYKRAEQQITGKGRLAPATSTASKARCRKKLFPVRVLRKKSLLDQETFLSKFSRGYFRRKEKRSSSKASVRSLPTYWSSRIPRFNCSFEKEKSSSARTRTEKSAMSIKPSVLCPPRSGSVCKRGLSAPLNFSRKQHFKQELCSGRSRGRIRLVSRRISSSHSPMKPITATPFLLKNKSGKTGSIPSSFSKQSEHQLKPSSTQAQSTKETSKMQRNLNLFKKFSAKLQKESIQNCAQNFFNWKAIATQQTENSIQKKNICEPATDGKTLSNLRFSRHYRSLTATRSLSQEAKKQFNTNPICTIQHRKARSCLPRATADYKAKVIKALRLRRSQISQKNKTCSKSPMRTMKGVRSSRPERMPICPIRKRLLARTQSKSKEKVNAENVKTSQPASKPLSIVAPTDHLPGHTEPQSPTAVSQSISAVKKKKVLKSRIFPKFAIASTTSSLRSDALLWAKELSLASLEADAKRAMITASQPLSKTYSSGIDSSKSQLSPAVSQEPIKLSSICEDVHPNMQANTMIISDDTLETTSRALQTAIMNDIISMRQNEVLQTSKKGRLVPSSYEILCMISAGLIEVGSVDYSALRRQGPVGHIALKEFRLRDFDIPFTKEYRDRLVKEGRKLPGTESDDPDEVIFTHPEIPPGLEDGKEPIPEKTVEPERPKTPIQRVPTPEPTPPPSPPPPPTKRGRGSRAGRPSRGQGRKRGAQQAKPTPVTIPTLPLPPPRKKSVSPSAITADRLQHMTKLDVKTAIFDMDQIEITVPVRPKPVVEPSKDSAKSGKKGRGTGRTQPVARGGGRGRPGRFTKPLEPVEPLEIEKPRTSRGRPRTRAEPPVPTRRATRSQVAAEKMMPRVYTPRIPFYTKFLESLSRKRVFNKIKVALRFPPEVRKKYFATLPKRLRRMIIHKSKARTVIHPRLKKKVKIIVRIPPKNKEQKKKKQKAGKKKSKAKKPKSGAKSTHKKTGKKKSKKSKNSQVHAPQATPENIVKSEGESLNYKKKLLLDPTFKESIARKLFLRGVNDESVQVLSGTPDKKDDKKPIHSSFYYLKFGKDRHAVRKVLEEVAEEEKKAAEEKAKLEKEEEMTKQIANAVKECGKCQMRQHMKSCRVCQMKRKARNSRKGQPRCVNSNSKRRDRMSLKKTVVRAELVPERNITNEIKQIVKKPKKSLKTAKERNVRSSILASREKIFGKKEKAEFKKELASFVNWKKDVKKYNYFSRTPLTESDIVMLRKAEAINKARLQILIKNKELSEAEKETIRKAKTLRSQLKTTAGSQKLGVQKEEVILRKLQLIRRKISASYIKAEFLSEHDIFIMTKAKGVLSRMEKLFSKVLEERSLMEQAGVVPSSSKTNRPVATDLVTPTKNQSTSNAERLTDASVLQAIKYISKDSKRASSILKKLSNDDKLIIVQAHKFLKLDWRVSKPLQDIITKGEAIIANARSLLLEREVAKDKKLQKLRLKEYNKRNLQTYRICLMRREIPDIKKRHLLTRTEQKIIRMANTIQIRRNASEPDVLKNEDAEILRKARRIVERLDSVWEASRKSEGILAKEDRIVADAKKIMERMKKRITEAKMLAPEEYALLEKEKEINSKSQSLTAEQKTILKQTARIRKEEEDRVRNAELLSNEEKLTLKRSRAISRKNYALKTALRKCRLDFSSVTEKERHPKTTNTAEKTTEVSQIGASANKKSSKREGSQNIFDPILCKKLEETLGTFNIAHKVSTHPNSSTNAAENALSLFNIPTVRQVKEVRTPKLSTHFDSLHDAAHKIVKTIIVKAKELQEAQRKRREKEFVLKQAAARAKKDNRIFDMNTEPGLTLVQDCVEAAKTASKKAQELTYTLAEFKAKRIALLKASDTLFKKPKLPGELINKKRSKTVDARIARRNIPLEGKKLRSHSTSNSKPAKRKADFSPSESSKRQKASEEKLQSIPLLKKSVFAKDFGAKALVKTKTDHGKEDLTSKLVREHHVAEATIQSAPVINKEEKKIPTFPRDSTTPLGGTITHQIVKSISKQKLVEDETRNRDPEFSKKDRRIASDKPLKSSVAIDSSLEKSKKSRSDATEKNTEVSKSKDDREKVVDTVPTVLTAEKHVESKNGDGNDKRDDEYFMEPRKRRISHYATAKKQNIESGVGTSRIQTTDDTQLKGFEEKKEKGSQKKTHDAVEELGYRKGKDKNPVDITKTSSIKAQEKYNLSKVTSAEKLLDNKKDANREVNREVSTSEVPSKKVKEAPSKEVTEVSSKVDFPLKKVGEVVSKVINFESTITDTHSKKVKETLQVGRIFEKRDTSAMNEEIAQKAAKVLLKKRAESLSKEEEDALKTVKEISMKESAIREADVLARKEEAVLREAKAISRKKSLLKSSDVINQEEPLHAKSSLLARENAKSESDDVNSRKPKIDPKMTSVPIKIAPPKEGRALKEDEDSDRKSKSTAREKSAPDSSEVTSKKHQSQLEARKKDGKIRKSDSFLKESKMSSKKTKHVFEEAASKELETVTRREKAELQEAIELSKKEAAKMDVKEREAAKMNRKESTKADVSKKEVVKVDTQPKVDDSDSDEELIVVKKSKASKKNIVLRDVEIVSRREQAELRAAIELSKKEAAMREAAELAKKVAARKEAEELLKKTKKGVDQHKNAKKSKELSRSDCDSDHTSSKDHNELKEMRKKEADIKESELLARREKLQEEVRSDASLISSRKEAIQKANKEVLKKAAALREAEVVSEKRVSELQAARGNTKKLDIAVEAAKDVSRKAVALREAKAVLVKEQDALKEAKNSIKKRAAKREAELETINEELSKKHLKESSRKSTLTEHDSLLKKQSRDHSEKDSKDIRKQDSGKSLKKEMKNIGYVPEELDVLKLVDFSSKANEESSWKTKEISSKTDKSLSKSGSDQDSAAEKLSKKSVDFSDKGRRISLSADTSHSNETGSSKSIFSPQISPASLKKDSIKLAKTKQKRSLIESDSTDDSVYQMKKNVKQAKKMPFDSTGLWSDHLKVEKKQKQGKKSHKSISPGSTGSHSSIKDSQKKISEKLKVSSEKKVITKEVKVSSDKTSQKSLQKVSERTAQKTKEEKNENQGKERERKRKHKRSKRAKEDVKSSTSSTVSKKQRDVSVSTDESDENFEPTYRISEQTMKSKLFEAVSSWGELCVKEVLSVWENNDPITAVQHMSTQYAIEAYKKMEEERIREEAAKNIAETTATINCPIVIEITDCEPMDQDVHVITPLKRDSNQAGTDAACERSVLDMYNPWSRPSIYIPENFGLRDKLDEQEIKEKTSLSSPKLAAKISGKQKSSVDNSKYEADIEKDKTPTQGSDGCSDLTKTPPSRKTLIIHSESSKKPDEEKVEPKSKSPVVLPDAEQCRKSSDSQLQQKRKTPINYRDYAKVTRIANYEEFKTNLKEISSDQGRRHSDVYDQLRRSSVGDASDISIDGTSVEKLETSTSRKQKQKEHEKKSSNPYPSATGSRKDSNEPSTMEHKTNKPTPQIGQNDSLKIRKSNEKSAAVTAPSFEKQSTLNESKTLLQPTSTERRKSAELFVEKEKKRKSEQEFEKIKHEKDRKYSGTEEVKSSSSQIHSGARFMKTEEKMKRDRSSSASKVSSLEVGKKSLDTRKSPKSPPPPPPKSSGKPDKSALSSHSSDKARSRKSSESFSKKSLEGFDISHFLPPSQLPSHQHKQGTGKEGKLHEKYTEKQESRLKHPEDYDPSKLPPPPPMPSLTVLGSTPKKGGKSGSSSHSSDKDRSRKSSDPISRSIPRPPQQMPKYDFGIEQAKLQEKARRAAQLKALNDQSISKPSDPYDPSKLPPPPPMPTNEILKSHERRREKSGTSSHSSEKDFIRKTTTPTTSIHVLPPKDAEMARTKTKKDDKHSRLHVSRAEKTSPPPESYDPSKLPPPPVSQHAGKKSHSKDKVKLHVSPPRSAEKESKKRTYVTHDVHKLSLNPTMPSNEVTKSSQDKDKSTNASKSSAVSRVDYELTPSPNVPQNDQYKTQRKEKKKSSVHANPENMDILNLGKLPPPPLIPSREVDETYRIEKVPRVPLKHESKKRDDLKELYKLPPPTPLPQKDIGNTRQKEKEKDACETRSVGKTLNKQSFTSDSTKLSASSTKDSTRNYGKEKEKSASVSTEKDYLNKTSSLHDVHSLPPPPTMPSHNSISNPMEKISSRKSSNLPGALKIPSSLPKGSYQTSKTLVEKEKPILPSRSAVKEHSKSFNEDLYKLPPPPPMPSHDLSKIHQKEKAKMPSMNKDLNQKSSDLLDVYKLPPPPQMPLPDFGKLHQMEKEHSRRTSETQDFSKLPPPPPMPSLDLLHEKHKSKKYLPEKTEVKKSFDSSNINASKKPCKDKLDSGNEESKTSHARVEKAGKLSYDQRDRAKLIGAELKDKSSSTSAREQKKKSSETSDHSKLPPPPPMPSLGAENVYSSQSRIKSKDYNESSKLSVTMSKHRKSDLFVEAERKVKGEQELFKTHSESAKRHSDSQEMAKSSSSQIHSGARFMKTEEKDKRDRSSLASKVSSLEVGKKSLDTRKSVRSPPPPPPSYPRPNSEKSHDVVRKDCNTMNDDVPVADKTYQKSTSKGENYKISSKHNRTVFTDDSKRLKEIAMTHVDNEEKKKEKDKTKTSIPTSIKERSATITDSLDLSKLPPPPPMPSLDSEKFSSREKVKKASSSSHSSEATQGRKKIGELDSINISPQPSMPKFVSKAGRKEKEESTLSQLAREDQSAKYTEAYDPSKLPPPPPMPSLDAGKVTDQDNNKTSSDRRLSDNLSMRMSHQRKKSDEPIVRTEHSKDNSSSKIKHEKDFKAAPTTKQVYDSLKIPGFAREKTHEDKKGENERKSKTAGTEYPADVRKQTDSKKSQPMDVTSRTPGKYERYSDKEKREKHSSETIASSSSFNEAGRKHSDYSHSSRRTDYHRDFSRPEKAQERDRRERSLSGKNMSLHEHIRRCSEISDSTRRSTAGHSRDFDSKDYMNGNDRRDGSDSETKSSTSSSSKRFDHYHEKIRHDSSSSSDKSGKPFQHKFSTPRDVSKKHIESSRYEDKPDKHRNIESSNSYAYAKKLYEENSKKRKRRGSGSSDGKSEKPHKYRKR